MLRNKISTEKKTLYFYTSELQKWPWKNKQNAHQCCNAWLGLQSTWKHIFQVCEIPFRYLSGSCEFCMSTAAKFFFQVPWNLLSFCCKIQYFTVARHLTFSALSSCPFTCIHLFFPSVFFTIRNSFDYSKYSMCSQWVQASRGQGTEEEFQLLVKDWEDDD